MGYRNPQETDMARKNPPDNPLHEEKQQVGQHTSVDPEPKEFDNKTQHGEQSDARKGSQPGLTGHSDRSGKDRNEGRPLAPK
jgi:hypothetical protein